MGSGLIGGSPLSCIRRLAEVEVFSWTGSGSGSGDLAKGEMIPSRYESSSSILF
jgi:hypothetical protein